LVDYDGADKAQSEGPDDATADGGAVASAEAGMGWKAQRLALRA
jgi:hypothetical protein